MAGRTFTTAEKIQLANGWVAARARGERQESYAARHSSTARGIRDYVNEYVVDDPALRAKEIIADAVARLQQVLVQLDEPTSTPALLPARTESPPMRAPRQNPDPFEQDVSPPCTDVPADRRAGNEIPLRPREP